LDASIQLILVAYVRSQMLILEVTTTHGHLEKLEIDDPDTKTVYDLKNTLSVPYEIPIQHMTITDTHGNVLQDNQTVSEVKLDAVNNRVTLTSPMFRPSVSQNSSAKFVGYLILVLIALLLLFVIVGFAESSYNSVNSMFKRMTTKQWREGRPSVFVELLIFFGVLVLFALMIWQLALNTSSSDAANEYGSSDIYPNPNDPLQPDSVPIPAERPKKLSIKQRLLAILGVIVIILLLILVAYFLKNEKVQDAVHRLVDKKK
jgi:hypothetical protein